MNLALILGWHYVTVVILLLLKTNVSLTNVAGFSPVGYNHMSPHQRVSPTKVRSPMYAGSPGALQPHSPYRHAALQQSPPDQVGPHQMASSPHQFAVQNPTAPYSPYSGTTQAAHNSAGQPRGVFLSINL